MNLKELRTEEGKLSGVIISDDDIAELSHSFKTNSQLLKDLKTLMTHEREIEADNRTIFNGVTIAETHARTKQTIEELY